jgi:hypothetical protein
MSFSECSAEILEIIIKELKLRTTISLANTCRHFRRVIGGCAQYWRDQCNHEWDMSIRPMVELDLFVTAKIQDDVFGFSPMRRFLMLKQIQYNWRRAKYSLLTYEMPLVPSDESYGTVVSPPQIIVSNIWATLIKQDSECYILSHLNAKAGLQRLLVQEKPTAIIKHADCKLSARINSNYVLLLITWERSSMYWQQAFVWTHDNYARGVELYIPQRVTDIEMLSGHWAALKTVPDHKYKKYALQLYHLKHPEKIRVPSPEKHHVYHDHFDPNTEEFTFYAVSIDTTKHQRIFTRYHIDAEYKLSVVENRVDSVAANVKTEYTWKSFPLSNNAFAVAGTPFGGHFHLYVYNNGPPLSLNPEVGNYYASSNKGALIFVKRNQFGLCYLSTLRNQRFVKVAPGKNFRTPIMGQFCVLEHTPGVFTIADSYYPIPKAPRTISLTGYLPNGVEANISEMGMAFISGMKLHVCNVCGLL